MRSSAAVAHLPGGLMCCSFKVVDGGYLSHCCLRVTSDQSAQSPLTPGNNEVLSLRELLLSRHFLFSRMPRERPSRPAVSETLRQSHLSSQITFLPRPFPTCLNTKLTWDICINLQAKQLGLYVFLCLGKKKQSTVCNCATPGNFKASLNTTQPGGDKNA